MRTAAALLALTSLAAAADLHVGAAKRTITPDLQTANRYMAGFGQNRIATAVHDDLWVRCMAFRAGKRPLVLCGADSIGLFRDDVEKVRSKLPDADVVIAATHDHEAPDTMGQWGPGFGKTGIDEAYNQYVVTRTLEAARAAIGNLQPAELRFAKIQSQELDNLLHDTRPPVRLDSELTALLAKARNGSVIGTLVNWANHPEALDSRNTEITADYLAYFHPVLEKQFGGTSVFLNGAVGGMQSPLGAQVIDEQTGLAAKQGTFRFAELIGTRVGRVASAALAAAEPMRITGVEYRETLLRIPMANPMFQAAAKAGIFGGRKAMNDDGTTTSPVGYAAFAGAAGPVLEIAFIPGEMYPELSLGGIERFPGADFADAPLEPPIKQQMTARFRMLAGLANDEIGYIIPKAEWDNQAPWLQNAPKRWYGEVNSIGPEAAPMINAAFAELVRTHRSSR